MIRAITGQKAPPAGTATLGPRPQTTVRQCRPAKARCPRLTLMPMSGRCICGIEMQELELLVSDGREPRTYCSLADVVMYQAESRLAPSYRLQDLNVLVKLMSAIRVPPVGGSVPRLITSFTAYGYTVRQCPRGPLAVHRARLSGPDDCFADCGASGGLQTSDLIPVGLTQRSLLRRSPRSGTWNGLGYTGTWRSDSQPVQTSRREQLPKCSPFANSACSTTSIARTLQPEIHGTDRAYYQNSATPFYAGSTGRRSRQY